jgi:hypothetical protein
MRVVFIAVLIAVTASAWATPILDPNSGQVYNELVNWNFENQPYNGAPWVRGEWIAVQLAGNGHAHGAKCINDTDPSGLWMYQIVDDTLNPLWRDNGTAKIVDLMADIRVMGDHTDSTATFRLGWWDTDYPIMPTLPTENGKPVFPATGFEWSDAVQCTFAEPGVWYTVNPFDRIVLPDQPRWIVVLVEYGQAPGEAIWVDNLLLTGQCIPEPSSLGVLIAGLVSAMGFRRLRRN